MTTEKQSVVAEIELVQILPPPSELSYTTSECSFEDSASIYSWNLSSDSFDFDDEFAVQHVAEN
jgi:hypothetical protein